MAKKKSKPTKKDQALQEYMEYLKEKGMIKKSFDEKLNLMIKEAFDEINQYSATELIEKCGKGPSTGFVDGVQYHKDNQRVTNGEAKVGDLEQKHLQKQLGLSSEGDVSQVNKIVNEFPEDLVGTGLHGDMWDSPNMTEDGAEYDEVMAWDDAVMDSSGIPYFGLDGATSSLEDAYAQFEGQMNNAPTLDDNIMLYGQDIPNPYLEEGDVFQLDTFMGVNFKKGMIGEHENMLENVDVTSARVNYNGSREQLFYGGRYNKSTPYDVTVLGSEGTPLLMTDVYKNGSQPNTHTGVLGKGQSVRLVRVNHEKKTAIYQTVDG